MNLPATFILETLAELYTFLQRYNEEIVKTTIEKVYNLGCTGFPEQSLVILTKRHAVDLFFDEKFSINIYPRTLFLDNLNNGIFRPPYDPDDFMYISQPQDINLKIKKIKPYTEHIGGGSHFVGIDILLAKGKTLHLERDDLVPGAMSSWLM